MHTTAHAVHRVPAESQKVVVVNGDPDVLELLEGILDAGRYDMVFVESNSRAYSRIKRVQPDLVILCVDINAPDAFHLLSMLKLDDETKRIPLLTYTNELAGLEDDQPEAEDDEDEIDLSLMRPTLTMN